MRCATCRNEAVFFQASSGRHLCIRHLVLDIEARAKRSIRSHRWITPGDHIAVVVSGEKKSAALLYFFKKLTADRRDIRLSAIALQEGSTGAGSGDSCAKIAGSLGIPVLYPSDETGPEPAGYGTVTKTALPLSLDDIAEEVLGQFLFGNVKSLVSSPEDRDAQPPAICPFMTIPSEELDLYSDNAGLGTDLPPDSPARGVHWQETRNLLYTYSRNHPSTKYALLHLAGQVRDGSPVAAVAVNIAGQGGRSGDKPIKGEKTEQLKNSF